MSTISIATPDGPIDALLDTPQGPGPWPGVVVDHDAIGYRPDNEEISARIAAAGYLALTPDLFSRGGRARCIPRVFRDLLTRRGRTLDDILSARDHLRSLPDCTGAIGIAGFCLGGQFALILGPRGFGASAPFYGTPLPRHLDETLDASCPIVASFGRRDPAGIGAPRRLRAIVEAKNIPADVKVYPDAGHGFSCDERPEFHAPSHELALERTLAFFTQHLDQ